MAVQDRSSKSQNTKADCGLMNTERQALGNCWKDEAREVTDVFIGPSKEPGLLKENTKSMAAPASIGLTAGFLCL